MREQLQEFKDAGLRRIVALRGDLPSGYGQFGEFRFASELVAFIRQETGDHFHIEVAAYPEYHRVVQGDDGVYRVPDKGIALRHRLQVGTIVGESAMLVKWLSGGTLGQVEESFIARLNKGDCFVFAGRLLEYVRTRDLTAYVRKAGVLYSWGLQQLILVVPMVAFILHPLAGLVGAVAVVAAMVNFDRFRQGSEARS